MAKLGRRGDRERWEAVGRITGLWAWAMQFAPDGDLTNFSAIDIAEASGIPAHLADWWIKTLIESGGPRGPGFLERVGGRLLIHDWAEYGGRVAKRREKDRLRKESSKPMNFWKVWIDVHREMGLPDPALLGPDLRAGKQVAEVLKDPEVLMSVMRLYLRDSEPFVAREGHPLRKLPARVNGYVQALSRGGNGKYAVIDGGQDDR